MSLARTLRPNAGHVVVLIVLGLLAFWLVGQQAESQFWRPLGNARIACLAGCVMLYAIGCLYMFRRHHRNVETEDHAPHRERIGVEAQPVFRVLYASQTGFAEWLAQRTAESLRFGANSACVEPLDALDFKDATASHPVLFVVSTTGEGDAPDSVAAFMQRIHSSVPDLSGLRYGLLSLGDSSYAEYCAFGRRFERWLRKRGATSLFDTVEVDNGDEAALRHWQHHLALLSGCVVLPDWQAPDYLPWRLDRRNLLNPGSQGEPCYLIRLSPKSGMTDTWQAGDIVEIGPRNDAEKVADFLRQLDLDGQSKLAASDRTLREHLSYCLLPEANTLRHLSAADLVAALKPLPHREYSMASLPTDGCIELVVRRMQSANGQPGIGSGWLTQHASIGGDIDVRIRRNSSFHSPVDDVPMLLIGNGTGIAGLRAHLKARIAAGRRRNWLLFGERNVDRDFLFRDEILGWQTDSWIERLDLAFSRDQVERIYVQDRLRAAKPALKAWIEADGVVYVCGSLAGMAPGVHDVLIEALGESQVIDLMSSGRYRRDVY